MNQTPFKKRTKTCGELRTEQINEIVILNGWVNSVRNFGSIYFIDIRDRYGITQAVIDAIHSPELVEKAKTLRSEFVISVTGLLRKRENPNKVIPTGEVEVEVTDLTILNESKALPFEISDTATATEETRLRLRYLDLRRPSIQQNFIMRNKVYQIVHSYFAEQNFIEFETPILTKSTPEGARDYLVPSRVQKGKFYALPQSPQLYKQILMISGYDRYMQIVKCFRDEDLRADRQPEFTQIDVEMSFIDETDIQKLTEKLVIRLWKELKGIELQPSFPMITYKDAYERYGSDKPDLRFGLELQTISPLLTSTGFSVFETVLENKGSIASIVVENGATFSRKEIDELTETVKTHGAKGLSWIKVSNEGVNSPLEKVLGLEKLQEICTFLSAPEDSIVFIVADSYDVTYKSLGALRLQLAHKTGIFAEIENTFHFSWVIDFPLLEFSEEDKRWVARHHPFTSPKEDHIELLTTKPEQALARAYDLVINGYEVAGGSIRIHKNELQQTIFSLLGISAEEAESKFGFLLDALQFGAPPHGGIAFGLDRLVMILCGTTNIRDVVAFPKTTAGISLMDKSPSEVDDKQLKELSIAKTV